MLGVSSAFAKSKREQQYYGTATSVVYFKYCACLISALGWSQHRAPQAFCSKPHSRSYCIYSLRLDKPPPEPKKTTWLCEDSVRDLNDTVIVAETWAAIWFQCGHRKSILMCSVNVITVKHCWYGTHANLRYHKWRDTTEQMRTGGTFQCT